MIGKPEVRRTICALVLSIAAFALIAAPASAATQSASMGTISAITGKTVHLTGTVDPGDGESNWSFETSADGTEWSGFAYQGSIAGGSGPQPVEATLGGLKGGTTYFARLRVIDFNEGLEAESPSPYPEFTTLAVNAPVVTISDPTQLASHSAHFSATVNPNGNVVGNETDWRFECEPSCEGLSGTTGLGTTPQTVEADATGLKSNTAYTVKLIAVNGGGEISAGPKSFSTTPGTPGQMVTLPALAEAGGTSALVGGELNPENSATKFWIEYGPDDTYGQVFPAGKDGEAGSGENLETFTETLTGLTPGSTYHYRIVASNTGGTEAGTDETFTTPTAGLGTSIGKVVLPDNRTWEMVSPVDKNNADVWKNAEVASVSGDRIAFKSQGSFAGQPTARGGQLTDYVATRGETTWTTQGIAPPRGRFNFNTGYQLFSDELDYGFLNRTEFDGEESIDPEAPPATAADGFGHGRFYLRDNRTGKFKLFPRAFGWASSDFSTFAFASSEKLSDDSPCDESGECVFERHADGSIELVSVSPEGDPVEGQLYGAEGAVSKDGSHVFFTSGGHAYVRIDSTETLQIDESERTSPPTVPGGETHLVGVDIQGGQRALLESSEELTDGDEDGETDLYLWDSTAPEGERLTLISDGDNPGPVQAFVSAGEELQHVYFASPSQLLDGEPNLPGNKFYVWTDTGGDGSLAYVTNLSTNIPDRRVSPDGRYFAFLSADRVTAYDSEGRQQVYRYDSATGQLACVSCDPNGAPGTTEAQWNPIAEDGVVTTPHTLRNVSTGGQVFFHTTAALVPKDSNGQQDVYEYEDGLPFLISSGVGPNKARFQDASRDGSNVFFTTADRLVGWDVDGNNDIYDARVGAGLPEPPLGVLGCDGDSCQPAPNPPNDPTPASSNFNGAGNVKQSFPKHHKKKQKKKKHHKKKQKRSHGNSTRKNG